MSEPRPESQGATGGTEDARARLRERLRARRSARTASGAAGEATGDSGTGTASAETRRAALQQRLAARRRTRRADAPETAQATPSHSRPTAKRPARPEAAGGEAAAPAAEQTGRRTAGGARALARRRVARRQAASAPATARRAPARPIRTRCPYVDDAVFDALPARLQALLRAAAQDRPGLPVAKLRARLPLRRRQELETAAEGVTAGLGRLLRPGLVPAGLPGVLELDPDGELTLRHGNGRVKVRARCWELFFLQREPEPLPADDVQALARRVASLTRLEPNAGGPDAVGVEQPVRFGDRVPACCAVFERSGRGWLGGTLRRAVCFADPRVTLLVLEPATPPTSERPAAEASFDVRAFVQRLAAGRHTGSGRP